jgi:hypothetical protein
MKVSQSLYKLHIPRNKAAAASRPGSLFFYLTGKILPKCEIENEVNFGSFDHQKYKIKK